MSGWQKMCLSDLCSLITDGKHGDCRDENGSGYYFLSVKDVLGGRLVYDNARQIAESDFLETHQRTNLSPGDILFTNTGTIGRMAIAADDPKTYRTTFQKSVAILKPKQKIILPRLFYYLLQFDNARLSEFAAGTTQKNLLLKDFRTFTVHVPPLSEQRAIASVLGSLDDKIDLNRRMNETLEALARALFQSRFVDATQAGLPKGWREGTLGDVAENPRRGVQPDEIKPATPYIGLEHMPRRCIALSDWGHADELESNKFEFMRGEILFGKLRPYFHKVGVAPLDGVCSTDILVVTPKEPAWFGFVLGHVSSVELVNHTDAASTGTKMPRTNWQDIARYEVALPPETLAAKFSELIQPLIDRIIANIHESRTLAALRDALLPKLLSGELRVPAAAKHVEAYA